ncbi:hypothetical protein QDY71_03095 [Kingella negevensis]|uniref:Uncharacterized protein n=1 Tax=Kingella negevensis TaxID=1522312 RepID=A0A238HHS4_9NEIS|nr:hypothetical protein [Kingella negevensis]MDK4679604.1 hypothetical protein [Kingella negevensis]MDK4682678.1 hypothetical protein [Kingella negevensis]MDK4685539.1 hypothetical protein [Kingella negevensis]MDK4690875.1 hypothetical protein [Kingella negevensis]MDK4693978.1 hypothetical protein [Kingella negevensis]
MDKKAKVEVKKEPTLSELWRIVDNSPVSQSGFQAVVPFGKLMSLLPKSLKHGIPAFYVYCVLNAA